MGKSISIYVDELQLESIKKKYPEKTQSKIITDLIYKDLLETNEDQNNEVKKIKSILTKLEEQNTELILKLINQEKLLNEQSNASIMTNRKIETVSEELKDQSNKHFIDLLDGIKKLGNVSFNKLETLIYLSNYIAYDLYKNVQSDTEIPDYQLEDLIGSEKAYIILNSKIEQAMKKDKQLRFDRFQK